jgi:tRNA pseudouridine38-40 synthase
MKYITRLRRSNAAVVCLLLQPFVVMNTSSLEAHQEPDQIKPRYFMRMAYDGSNYHGWQRQPNAHTVQAELESGLCKLLRQSPVITTGCGRTDAGVHASDFYLHFECEREIADPIDLMFKLNNCLPKDLAIYGIWRVADRAHARFDAIERSYAYHVHTRREPFVRLYSAFYPYQLDIGAMNEAAQLLLGQKDFAVFSKAGGGQKTTICDVRRAEWIQDGVHLTFHITANRFLRNMVRAVVGTLFDVGKGKLTVEEFSNLLLESERALAGDSVFANGLTLTEVKYPSEMMDTFVPMYSKLRVG